MRVGRSRGGNFVRVEDVSRGHACDSVCACCGESLSARQGEEREWHFAHQPGEHCSKRRWLSMQVAAFLRASIGGRHLTLPGRHHAHNNKYDVIVDNVLEELSFEPLVIQADVRLRGLTSDAQGEQRSALLAMVIKLPWDRDFEEPDWAARGQRAIALDLRPYFSHPDEQIVEALCSGARREWRWNNWPNSSKPPRPAVESKAITNFSPGAYLADSDARWKRFWTRGRGR